MLQNFMTWLGTLPFGTLFAVAGTLAAFENIFPPFPSDLVVAFTVFLAARAGGPFWLAALSVWFGSTVGAMIMYYVGKRYGSLVLLEKLEHFAGKQAGERLQEMHSKYGVAALFISRFVPGVRAVVPPFAGAMKIPAWQVLVSMSVAGALWYGFVAYLAYEAGENWQVLAKSVTGTAKIIGLIAAGIAAIVAAVVYFRRKRAPSDGAI
jgi:LPXTG-motif cell wall-anchored protein